MRRSPEPSAPIVYTAPAVPSSLTNAITPRRDQVGVPAGREPFACLGTETQDVYLPAVAKVGIASEDDRSPAGRPVGYRVRTAEGKSIPIAARHGRAEDDAARRQPACKASPRRSRGDAFPVSDFLTATAPWRA